METFFWHAASLGEENPQAVFRDASPDAAVLANPSLPAEVSRTIGRGCGRRVLPYRMQDRYGRSRQVRPFRAVVLENENLKATFLPELGGRLISLYYKPAQRELLFNNRVFQPANLALRDAWFAGGIEWNIGQYGHAFHTCSPVFAAEISAIGGGRGLRIYDYDRCKGLLWQIDFHLPPGAHFLYAFTRVVNPRPEEVAMYWWSNVAVPETPGLRVLAPAAQSVYVDYANYLTHLTYGQGELPSLPTIGGRDGTYPENLSFTNEFFFQCQAARLPWEAALDASGAGFIEASTQPLNVRKLFCWGMHRGGRRWQEFLCGRGQSYLEVQAGLTPTQQHTVPMPAGAQWSWTQAFGYVEADPAKVHGPDWPEAFQSVELALQNRLTPGLLADVHRACAVQADAAPREILMTGTGWGALEVARRAAGGESKFPSAFAFPDSSMGDEPKRWRALLETGRLPEADPAHGPGDWMIQPEWKALLEDSLKHPANRHWFALLHLGVMRVEAFDEAGAAAAWEESIRLRPSAWAWRNLGALALRRGAPEEALPAFARAWELASAAGTPDISFASEYLSALLAAKRHRTAWSFYSQLPPELQTRDAVRLLAAKVAFELDDLAFVESVLAGEFASIREGARDLTDLWFGLQVKRLAARTGRAVDAALIEEVKKTSVPPELIDFRVIE
jgi:tetratricopeptide (TPR) repeat protein